MDATNDTARFVPRDSSWTGTVHLRITPGGFEFDRTADMLTYRHQWDTLTTVSDGYRGFAKFDISSLPSGALVTSAVWMLFQLNGTNARVRARRLLCDPDTVDAEALWYSFSDSLSEWTPFVSSWNTLELNERAVAEVQRQAAGDSWVAFGVEQKWGGNGAGGLAYGGGHRDRPVLKVTYALGAAEATGSRQVEPCRPTILTRAQLTAELHSDPSLSLFDPSGRLVLNPKSGVFFLRTATTTRRVIVTH